MYPQRQQQYQTMDAGTLYHQPPLPQQQQQSYPTPQPEPLPSATDVHTAALSISQMANFHLQWCISCGMNEAQLFFLFSLLCFIQVLLLEVVAQAMPLGNTVDLFTSNSTV
ncbi:unnamed protein product [Absidia cylindrospora]